MAAGIAEILKQSHRIATRVALTYNGSTIDQSLPVTDGSVTGSRQQAVRRTLDLTVTETNTAARKALWEALTKPGMELKAYRGVVHLDGSIDESPVGVFLVRQPKFGTDGRISMSGCPDLMQRVIDARFEAPRTARSGFTMAQQVESLLREVVPRLAFRDELRNGTAMPSATWERDRVDAVAQVAIAAGGEVWVDPSGAFVLGRPAGFADRAKWKFNTRNGGIASAQAEVDWASVYNIVVATGERSDGTAPFSATARDTDPASVTYWRGAMGPKPRFYASPLLTSTAACQRAAETILLRSIGARRSLSVESVANPWMDVADRVDVTLLDEGISERHIIDSFRLPLFSAGMSFTTRAVGQVVTDE